MFPSRSPSSLHGPTFALSAFLLLLSVPCILLNFAFSLPSLSPLTALRLLPVLMNALYTRRVHSFRRGKLFIAHSFSVTAMCCYVMLQISLQLHSFTYMFAHRGMASRFMPEGKRERDDIERSADSIPRAQSIIKYDQTSIGRMTSTASTHFGASPLLFCILIRDHILHHINAVPPS